MGGTSGPFAPYGPPDGVCRAAQILWCGAAVDCSAAVATGSKIRGLQQQGGWCLFVVVCFFFVFFVFFLCFFTIILYFFLYFFYTFFILFFILFDPAATAT